MRSMSKSRDEDALGIGREVLSEIARVLRCAVLEVIGPPFPEHSIRESKER